MEASKSCKYETSGLYVGMHRDTRGWVTTVSVLWELHNKRSATWNVQHLGGDPTDFAVIQYAVSVRP